MPVIRQAGCPGSLAPSRGTRRAEKTLGRRALTRDRATARRPVSLWSVELASDPASTLSNPSIRFHDARPPHTQAVRRQSEHPVLCRLASTPSSSCDRALAARGSPVLGQLSLRRRLRSLRRYFLGGRLLRRSLLGGRLLHRLLGRRHFLGSSQRAPKSRRCLPWGTLTWEGNKLKPRPDSSVSRSKTRLSTAPIDSLHRSCRVVCTPTVADALAP